MNPKPPPPPTLAAAELHQSEADFTERLPENESHIMLYAELLLHIRTITLFASLRSHHSRETKARLDADGSLITVSHEGYKATIRLPIKVSGKGDAALELPALPPSKELTLRLQLEEQDDSDMLGLMADVRKANIVPWDGVALSKQEGVELRCKNCEGVVLRSHAVSEWKDLPNENWAEMMDFWHCHKPDEHHLQDHAHEAGEQKGYAAGNRLRALDGVGLVDITSFLVREQDCEGAKVGQCSSSKFFRFISLGVQSPNVPLSFSFCSDQMRSWAQRRQTRRYPWHSRRYNRPRLMGSIDTLSTGQILFFWLTGRQRCWVSSLTFHCPYPVLLGIGRKPLDNIPP